MLQARKLTANLSIISQTAEAEMPLDLSISCFNSLHTLAPCISAETCTINPEIDVT